ncbi:MAG: glycosyltransferase involved in cell wall biosynthesis [Planctomycetota bacterium]|jgi:glycosyltransferase involved in cell wall biosynthesis
MTTTTDSNTARPRFGLDGAACVFAYPPGVARVAREVIQGLVSNDQIECIPLIPAVDDAQRTWRHRELPRLEKRLGLDAILSFTSAFPLLGKGLRVQTIHELPWRHDESENAGRSHRLWAKHGRRRAAKIIVPSQHVWDDLNSFAPAAAAQAAVIPWATSAPFGELGNDSISAVAPPGAYFLAVGATRPKKNLKSAIHGLAPFGKKGPYLVVTGPVTAEIESAMRLATTFGIEKRVRFVGEVDDEQLARLYSKATATLMLAGSEGFGFPALESMAAGTNVLHPPLTAQAELIGDLGTMVVPDLPDSMAKGMESALEEWRSTASLPRRQARIDRAKQFTWQRTCVAIAGVLRDAVRSKGLA